MSTKTQKKQTDKTTMNEVQVSPDAEMMNPNAESNDPTANMSPEELAETRKNMREAMRERFGKWMEIDDEDATDADIEAAKADFDAKVKEWTMKQFPMFEAEHALEALKLLKKWNETSCHWERDVWRGVILFDEIVSREIERIEKEGSTDELSFDYQTLMFLYHTMSTPKGAGIESAKLMVELEKFDLTTNTVEKDAVVTYSSILQKIVTHTNMLQLVDKMLNLYRERVTIAAAGIKCNFKITEVEEFKELHDAWVIPAGPDGNHAM